MFKQYYESPVGRLVMGSDGVALTDLCFVSSSHAEKVGMYEESPLPVFTQTKKWLDIYFSGKAPEFTPPIKLQDLSPFRKQVVNIISHIPYGKTMTYGEIAQKVASEREIIKMSAQAVGSGAKNNPICLIIPCHRVVGSNNKLVGYNGGLDKKIALLKLEKII